MATSVNKAILLGNLGRDPELRSIPSGKSVCSFSMATTERYLDKATNEWKDKTEWHNIVVWERLADYAAQKLKKGSKVYIEGKISNRSYEGKDGVTRYISEIIASTIIILDRNEHSSPSGNVSKTYDNQNNSNGEYADSPFEEEIDDDVPF